MKTRLLSADQRKAARLLARGFRTRDIAGELNCRPETVSRWKRLPEMHRELARLADLAADGETRTRTRELLPLALDVIAAALADPAPGRRAQRIEAARALLEFAAALEHEQTPR